MKHLIVTAAALLAFAGAQAQVNPQFSDLNDEIEMVRSMAKLERRTVIQDALQLTPEQSGPFWEVYGQYEQDMRAVNDKLVKVITDYAAVYETMDDKRAAELLKDYLGQQEAELKLRRKYVSRFSKVLPPKQVTRFYQIENKLNVLKELVLARQIPLVK